MSWWDDLALAEPVPAMAAIGIVAFTTTRHAGSFALGSTEPSESVWSRWLALASALSAHAPRLAFAHQVHGATVVEHRASWSGILRVPDADGHLSLETATAMAVTLADCVPVFIGHPSGVAGVVHSGWQGTVAGITAQAIAQFKHAGFDPKELVVHCGPSICGRCYEVGPEVYHKLTGQAVEQPTRVDLRALIAESARRAGVKEISVSHACTRHHNDRFYSHRAGDTGRQLGVVIGPPPAPPAPAPSLGTQHPAKH